jgi:hypothetical protein
VNARLKKLLPIVAVILALLLGAIAIYAILVGPSKQPYRDALTQYRNVYNANVAFTGSGSALNATGASDEEFTRNIETLRSAMASIRIESDALGTEAVLKEGEGQALYDAFEVKLTSYLDYNQSVIDSLEIVRPVLFECNQAMTSISQDAANAAALRDCADELEALQDIPDADYRQLVDEFAEAYSDAAEATSAIAELKDPDGDDKAALARLEDEQSTAIDELNDASTSLAANLRDSRSRVDITESAMALDDYLTKKSSLF